MKHFCEKFLLADQIFFLDIFEFFCFSLLLKDQLHVASREKTVNLDRNVTYVSELEPRELEINCARFLTLNM